MATWSARKALWQLNPVKALLQVGQDLSQQSKPQQLQLGGLANSVHSLWPATSNVIAIPQEAYGAQGLGCGGTLVLWPLAQWHGD